MIKRILFCVLFAVLLLASACIAPEKIPYSSAGEPDPTPKPTPAPIREPIGIPAEFAKQYCEEYGLEYEPEYDEAVLYARSTLPSDFRTIRPDFPEKLYLHPYNLWAEPSEDNGVGTNVECVEALGIEWIEEVRETAVEYSKLLYNRDYTTQDDEALRRALYYYLSSDTEKRKDYTTDFIESVREDEFIQIGTFVTDLGLVYQGSDGFLRIRGRQFMKIIHATEEYLEREDMKQNVWYWYDVEWVVGKDTPTEDAKYEHHPFVVFNLIYIPYVVEEADADMIALAEANMK